MAVTNAFVNTFPSSDPSEALGQNGGAHPLRLRVSKPEVEAEAPADQAPQAPSVGVRQEVLQC